ncbi:LUD domain-containing protein [uncultured Algibacter sp.]|uniref:LutC/YkgG family protein n=1 Tax=uncultured Algibacter sp. TaxID=298659 RepID=UPI002616BB04|nr:LUD domain-containing protein [uncultured Algibacter sp.]
MNGTKNEIKMGREAILQSIKENKPDLLPMPTVNVEAFAEDLNILEVFKNNIALVGGNIKQIEKKAIDTEVKTIYSKAKRIVSTSSKTALGTVKISIDTDPHELEDIDLAIVEGEFGVSENGAIWVTAENSIVRALPFITNDLVIILEKDKLYLHMHQAYDIISQRNRSFGVFISGPSKTADIEQCLVVGAHGAMSLTVLLV